MSDEQMSDEQWVAKLISDIPASVIAVESMEIVVDALRLHVSNIPDSVTRDELKQSLVDTTELLATMVTALKKVTIINHETREGLNAARAYAQRAREEGDGKVEDSSGGE